MAMTDGEEGACALVIGSNGERKAPRRGLACTRALQRAARA
jgi:hypothetical protein